MYLSGSERLNGEDAKREKRIHDQTGGTSLLVLLQKRLSQESEQPGMGARVSRGTRLRIQNSKFFRSVFLKVQAATY